MLEDPMAQECETLAVLGAGAMGSGMVHSALRADIPTVVWDRDRERLHDLAAAGADVEQTAENAVARAGIVITMVTDADAVVSVATDHGMLDALAPDAIWIQMSTIGVAGTERVVSLVTDRRPDVHLLDAPVSGSKEPAERGELTIFASGPEALRTRVDPVFDALGQQTKWVGPLGAGTRMKLVNNTLLAFTNEGVAASIALAHRLGLDASTVLDALGVGPLVSPWAAAKFERITRDDYSAQFALALALKDVHLALEAVDAGQFEAFASLAHEWERVVEEGLGSEDLTVVTRVLEDHGAAREP
jgi:3-hydroxyisobutyrate dehydrogenase